LRKNYTNHAHGSLGLTPANLVNKVWTKNNPRYTQAYTTTTIKRSYIEYMDKILIKTLQGPSLYPRPLWFMRQAGRYLPEYQEIRKNTGSFLDLCFNPEKAAEVTLQPLKRFPSIDAAILFSDILVIPLALGYGVDFIKGEGPSLEKVILGSLKSFNKDIFLKTLSPVFETIRLVQQNLSPQKALLGFAGGPWTVSTYMLEGGGSKDHSGAKQAVFSNPPLFDELIDLLTESTILYLKAQIAAGVDAVQLFESWAGVLPEPYYDQWVVTPLQKIIKALKELYPHIPIILFPKGNPSFYGKFFEDAVHADALSLESTADFERVSREIPAKVVLQGGLDPQLLVVGGEEMLKEADRILRIFSNRPYIFNLGHGITPNVPVSHVEELIQFVKAWRP
jgi:uroporphyrinogen decarboxylase